MEISKKQATLGGIVVLLLVLGAAAAGGVLGGIAGYAVGQERNLPEQTFWYGHIDDADAASVRNDAGPPTETATPRPGDGVREWIAELEARVAALERHQWTPSGDMGLDQLLPFLLMILGALFDGGWYGYGGAVADPVYPEDS